MKRLSFLAVFMLISVITFAQQALWGSQNIISPEIHPDNTVTFRFMAPKAIKVQVTGDFLPTQKMETQFGLVDVPGTVDLKEGKEGVWEYTTPEPLPSELYSYSFIVDGLKTTDPNNVYLNRDVASVTNIFIIKGGQGDLYSVNDVPHGTVARRWYESRHWERLAVLPFIRRPAMRQVAKNIRYSTSYMAWVATRKLGSP